MWSGKKVLLVSEADDRGLMYALLDVADRIGWAEDAQNPLSEVRNIEEKPAVAERALSIYTMHQGNFESYFKSCVDFMLHDARLGRTMRSYVAERTKA